MATICFKTKLRTIKDADGSNPRLALFWKVDITRKDCNLKPHQHPLWNFDGFPGILKAAYRKVIGDRDWTWADELPAGVTLDTSGFLATVTVQLPEKF